MAFQTLENDIESDMQTRSESMLSIRRLLTRDVFSDDEKKLLLQHSIPMVYSIWEGFVQTAFQRYVRELNRQEELTIDTVCEPILVYHLEAKFKQFKNYPDKFEKKTRFFNDLQEFHQSTRFEIHPTVNTESNVGFEVLSRILEQFKLEKIPDYPEISEINCDFVAQIPETRYCISTELKTLLRIRNAVAHGDQESISVTAHHLDRFIKLVNILMCLVSKRIFKGFNEKSYLKDSRSQK